MLSDLFCEFLGKTTIELPDDLFRAAKSTAAREGWSLRELFTEALREKLSRLDSGGPVPPPPWMKYFGAFENSSAESMRIQAAIDEEFGSVDPREE